MYITAVSHFEAPILLLLAKQMISAKIVPGSHPSKVSSRTSIIEPQPLSKTANGGNTKHNIILITKSIYLFFHTKNTAIRKSIIFAALTVEAVDFYYDFFHIQLLLS